MPKEKSAPAKPKKFSVIVAVDNNWGIGKDGKLPWRIKGDTQRFKEITCGKPGNRNAVVYGSNTFRSLPSAYRPLPDRLNVVMTREKHAAPFGLVLHAHSLDDALLAARCHAGINEVYVIGGGQVYAEALNHPECGEIFVTSIGATYDCDTFFPNLDGDDRFRLSVTEGPFEENGVPYVYQMYVRK